MLKILQDLVEGVEGDRKANDIFSLLRGMRFPAGRGEGIAENAVHIC